VQADSGISLLPANPVRGRDGDVSARVCERVTHLNGGPAMPRVVLTMFGFALAALAAAGTLGRAQEKTEEGYKSLFNGKDLTGWMHKSFPKVSLEGKTETPDGRFTVENGVIIVHEKDNKEKGGIKDLYTAGEFNKDFILKLEFRAAPKADSGVYIRGNQLQVRDYPTVGPYKPKSFKAGDWNELEIVVKGSTTSTTVNGKKLTDTDVLELATREGKTVAKLNGKEIDVKAFAVNKFTPAECKCNGEVIEKAFQVPNKGGIGLQAETGKFEFRNVRVKELP
jgi:hypothetical protein